MIAEVFSNINGCMHGSIYQSLHDVLSKAYSNKLVQYPLGTCLHSSFLLIQSHVE